MTEEEWISTCWPYAMLRAIEQARGKMPARKARLFSLACIERIDHLISDPRSQAVLEYASQHVETPINRQIGRGKIVSSARRVVQDSNLEMMCCSDAIIRMACLARSTAAELVVQTMNHNPMHAAVHSSGLVCIALGYDLMHAAGKTLMEDENIPEKYTKLVDENHCSLLRDIFGNPFRPVVFDPAWRSSTTVGIATAMYEDRAFDRMPILADALQDAGCENDDILTHCRGDGPHVRGCWVVDLVLGKE